MGKRRASFQRQKSLVAGTVNIRGLLVVAQEALKAKNCNHRENSSQNKVYVLLYIFKSRHLRSSEKHTSSPQMYSGWCSVHTLLYRIRVSNWQLRKCAWRAGSGAKTRGGMHRPLGNCKGPWDTSWILLGPLEEICNTWNSEGACIWLLGS
ncbi:hypothetical protein Pmani_017907 [Petrolisthes manimaculis]|uniref:Uncharacterized protein n=1 Tax=Petrolisthes manimaculis TaxID=1843537 RepID=A0AAE1U8X7_9EUCA|nr:hypothetical protein Pmani_017907 [Petrolisthes manimaculis]